MNAGPDYVRAKARAQANANWTGQPRQLHKYNGIWWIDRLNDKNPLIPGAETIVPEAFAPPTDEEPV